MKKPEQSEKRNKMAHTAASCIVFMRHLPCSVGCSFSGGRQWSRRKKGAVTASAFKGHDIDTGIDIDVDVDRDSDMAVPVNWGGSLWPGPLLPAEGALLRKLRLHLDSWLGRTALC